MAGLFGDSRGGAGPIGLFGRTRGITDEEQRRLAELASLAGELGGSPQSQDLPGIPPREPLAESLVPTAQLPLPHRVPLPGGGGLPFELPSNGSPFPPGFAGDPHVLGLPSAAGVGLGRSPVGGLRAEAEGYADQLAQRGTREWGSAVRNFVMQGPVSSGDDGVGRDEGPTGSEFSGAAEEEGIGFGPGLGLIQSRGFGSENEAESVRPAALFWEGEDSPTQFMRPAAFQESFDRTQERAIARQRAEEQAKRSRGNAGAKPQQRMPPVPVRPTQARPGSAPRSLEPRKQAPPQRPQAPAMPNPNAQRVLTPRELVKSRIRLAESTNDDRAVNSETTAKGRYQFIDATWKSLHRRFYGTDGLDDKFNPEKQERFMDVLMDENEAALRRAKFEPTARNLYLAHFAGWPSAIKLLRNPRASAEALMGRDAVRRNKDVLKGKTAAQVIEWADRKMNGDPPKAQSSRGRTRARVPRDKAELPF